MAQNSVNKHSMRVLLPSPRFSREESFRCGGDFIEIFQIEMENSRMTDLTVSLFHRRLT